MFDFCSFVVFFFKMSPILFSLLRALQKTLEPEIKKRETNNNHVREK